MAIITIIGAGMMGSALAFPARENGHEVRLVGTPLDEEIIREVQATGKHPKLPLPFPAGIKTYFTHQTAEAVKGADLIIGGVSSFGVEWFGNFVLPLLPAGVPVLTVTKGLLDTPDGRLIPYPHYWADLRPELCFNAIGGPCTSYELVAHDQTHVSFCGPDKEILRTLRKWMTTDYYHISLTTDVVGVESAVALKNGYALGVALTIGLNQRQWGAESPLHYNSQAAVFGQSVVEMTRLLTLQGADTLSNRAVGLGDLYVTVYGGRTRQIGILLGRGMDIDAARQELSGVTLESLVVAERVARAVRIQIADGRLQAADFPLLLHIDDLLHKKTDAVLPWEAFCREE